MKYKIIALGILTIITTALSAVEFPATTPFRSTAMAAGTTEINDPAPAANSGFRSVASQPTLDPNGFVQSPEQMATTTLSSSPRKATTNPNPPDPDEGEDPWNGQPVGDVLLPLILMSFGYTLFLFRRKESDPANL